MREPELTVRCCAKTPMIKASRPEPKMKKHTGPQGFRGDQFESQQSMRLALCNNNNDNSNDRCGLTWLDRAFQAYKTNSFCSVSRGDFEMRTEAVPPKLSREAWSIASTDTSEIAFGIPMCIHWEPTFCCTEQLEEEDMSRPLTPIVFFCFWSFF